MKIEQRKILKIPVAITSYKEVVNWATIPACDRQGKYICVANVHMCMEAFDDREFCRVVNDADLVVPDGRPLAWGLSALGHRKSTQVRGSDLMLKICARAEKEQIAIGLFGGTPDVLDRLHFFLRKKFPLLKIPFAHSPPFRPLTRDEDENYVREINKSGVRVLFLGIGCPKQEKWMAGHRKNLSCLMIGVGAAFDFFSGRIKPAPRWMQKAGLEWTYRLAHDFRRLWRRYLKHNPRFIWHFSKQWLSHVLAARK